MLARYSDPRGRLREVLTRPGFGGSVLVIDRDATTRGDRRLVAHLAPDEPSSNAALACNDYLSSARNRVCRPLQAEDLWIAPFAEEPHPRCEAHHDDPDPIDRHGRTYVLAPFAEGVAVRELRWQCRSPESGELRVLSLRDVVGALESYQPVRDITVRALSRHRHDFRLATSSLSRELTRLDISPIVLNRALREAVQRAHAQGLSMGEIAVRCGRFKHDAQGKAFGDTSWLARRVGLVPLPGKCEPTPWVHSDVLAVIARSGLGLSPREVELG